MKQSRFLPPELARSAANEFGTPCYIYDQASLEESAHKTLAFPNAYGLTVRYAMKASPNAAILKRFNSMGICIDASSGHEVERAILAGIAPHQISLSSQELAHNLVDLINRGVHFNACSLHQLKRFAQTFPGQSCGIRFNPGLGSGGTGKTNVGGPHSSFGIWHEHIPEVNKIVEQQNLKITRIHTHIGSGTDTSVWEKAARLSLDLVLQFPHVDTLNLGGGFKVGRMPDSPSTNIQDVGNFVKSEVEAFAANTGRKLTIEIEPGTFLVANAGSLLCTVQDVVSTSGKDGMDFIKLDAGMTEILRPSLYAAQHPINIIPQQHTTEEQAYTVVGHCCESGDLLTPAVDDAEKLAPRKLTKAEIGDLCIIDGTGAYCSGMSAKNYNSFPEAAEVLLQSNGEFTLIRKRQTLKQMLQNEV